MKPVSFNGCFGWLHTPQPEAASDVAVLICQGLMKEAMTAYVSVRKLADTFAAQGLPALRFDYPGTGDSYDPSFAMEGGHWTVWQRSIDESANWLLKNTGARRLVLCGFRIGATMAAVAAARRDDVAGLILIEPAIEGRSYVRQIALEAQLLHGRTPAEDEDLMVHELRLPAGSLAEIAAIDLRTVTPPSHLKAAIFARSDSRPLAECVANWRASGIDVDRPEWQGLDPMFADKMIEEAPLAEFDGLLNWLRREIPIGAARLPQSTTDLAELRLPGLVEVPVTFGPGESLFGILCRPERAVTQSVVIIGNCGHDPHYGPGRQSTSLARRLAAAGIASFRIDFSGLGDSLEPPGKKNVRSHVFTKDRSSELIAAIDTMEKMGFRQFGLQGNCSGAYHAFQVALDEPRISSLMLVNIPLFTLPLLDIVGHLNQGWLSPLHYAKKLFDPGSWALLLRGERNIGNAVRIQFLHAPARVLRRMRVFAQRVGLIPKRSFAWRAMEELSKRGVRTEFLISPTDPQGQAFVHEFGPSGEGLARFQNVAVDFIAGMDHGLMKARERGIAEQLLTDFAVEAAASTKEVSTRR